MNKKDVFEDLDENAPQVVTYARNSQEVETLRVLLEDHDIPVTIGQDDEGLIPPGDKRKGVAIMVPAELLADAREVIQERTVVVDEFSDHLEKIDDDDEDDDDDMDGFGPDIIDAGLFDEGEHDLDDFDYEDDFDDDDSEDLFL